MTTQHSSAGLTQKNKIKETSYWFLVFFISLMPPLVVYLLIRFNMKKNLHDFVPAFWVDQVDYWHEVATFIKAGFNGGFYGQGEIPATIHFFHFGPHGPIYPVIYGLIGRIFGWEFYSGILFNMAILAVSFILFSVIAKPNRLQLILAGLVCITFWPVSMYMPTISQETIHQAAGIILAGVFYVLLKERDKASGWLKWPSLFFILIIGVTRFSWGLLLIPFFMLITPPSLIRQALSFVLSFLLIGIVMAVSSMTSAPGWNTIFKDIEDSSKSLSHGLIILQDIINHNLAQISTVFKSKNLLDMGLYLQIAGIVIFYLIIFAILTNRHLKTDSRKDPISIQYHEAIFNNYNLILVTLTLFFIYVMESTSRIIGPHLLLTFLFMIMCKRYHPISIILIVNILLIPSFLSVSRSQWNPSFTTDISSLVEVRKSMETYVSYRDDVPNPWCNTMLSSYQYIYDQFLSTPPGIGLSFIWPGKLKTLEMPLRSQYFLIDDEKVSRLRATGKFNVKLLGILPNERKLYLNLDADCDFR